MANIFIERSNESTPLALGEMPYTSAFIGCVLELKNASQGMNGVGSDGRGFEPLLNVVSGDVEAYMTTQALRHGDSDITLRWRIGEDALERKKAMRQVGKFIDGIADPFNRQKLLEVDPVSSDSYPKLIDNLTFNLMNEFAVLIEALQTRGIPVTNQGHTRRLLDLMAATLNEGDFTKETISIIRGAPYLTRLDFLGAEGERFNYQLTRRRLLGGNQRFRELVQVYQERFGYGLINDRTGGLGPFLQRLYDHEFVAQDPILSTNLHRQRVLSPLAFRLLSLLGSKGLIGGISSEADTDE